MSEFFKGGVAYNGVNFALAAAGVFLAVVALWIAFVELRKVRDAATAARDAAVQTAAEFMKLAAVVSFSRVCGQSSQLHMLVREENVKAAAQRAFDLREGLAHLRFQQATTSLMQPREWQILLVRVAKLHDTLEKLARSTNSEAEAVAWCLEEIAAIHEQLSGLSGLSSNMKVVVTNADPRSLS